MTSVVTRVTGKAEEKKEKGRDDSSHIFGSPAAADMDYHLSVM